MLDKVNLDCWNTTDEVVDWMGQQGDGSLTAEAYFQQWSIFQNRAHDILTAANGGQEVPGELFNVYL